MQQSRDLLMESLRRMFTEEEIRDLVRETQKLGVLDAVVATRTIDTETLVQWLYHDKDQQVPVDHLRRCVLEFVPVLISEGSISADGQPTPEAISTSMLHQMMLADGQPRQ